MTSLILLIIGLGLICQGEHFVIGGILVLCAVSVASKDSDLSNFRSRVAKLNALLGDEEDEGDERIDEDEYR